MKNYLHFLEYTTMQKKYKILMIRTIRQSYKINNIGKLLTFIVKKQV